jgi:hypothetical protein
VVDVSGGHRGCLTCLFARLVGSSGSERVWAFNLLVCPFGWLFWFGTGFLEDRAQGLEVVGCRDGMTC